MTDKAKRMMQINNPVREGRHYKKGLFLSPFL